MVFTHGGFNLSSEWSGALKIVSNVSMLAMGLLWDCGRADAGDSTGDWRSTRELALVNCTVLSHYISPQYLNWLLPLALLLALNIFPHGWAIWSGFAVLAIVIVGIFSCCFPTTTLCLPRRSMLRRSRFA